MSDAVEKALVGKAKSCCGRLKKRWLEKAWSKKG